MSDPDDYARAADRTVGAALRARREELHLSQTELGDVLGVSHQQVAKYESGRDRIGAGSLAAAARFLDRDVSWFFGAEGGTGPRRSHRAVLPLEELLPGFAGDGLCVRVSFTRDAVAAWPGLTIETVTLTGAAGGAASGRAPVMLPRALPAMLRHGAAALLAAAEVDPVSRPDAAPRAGAVLN